MNYNDFLIAKTQAGADSGFAPVWLPDYLFDFQSATVDWAIRKGRAAILADCGLGKTPMELVYGENIVRKTGGKVLLLTALAVSPQIVAEAEKFGIKANNLAAVAHEALDLAAVCIRLHDQLGYVESLKDRSVK